MCGVSRHSLSGTGIEGRAHVQLGCRVRPLDPRFGFALHPAGWRFISSVLSFLKPPASTCQPSWNLCQPGCALRMAAYRAALDRVKAAQEHQMPSVSKSETAEEAHTLLTLQNHVLERIFVQLHLTDLARCCQVCKHLQSLVEQDSVWQALCTGAFPKFSTLELRGWINPTSLSNGRSQYDLWTPDTVASSSQAPRTYRSANPRSRLTLLVFRYKPTHSYLCRQLYPVLKQLEPLIGIWKYDKNADKPALYVFDWGNCCVEGRKLCYDLPGQEPFVEPFQQVGPGKRGSVQHVDSMHCLLTIQTGTPRSPITKAVQAATAVAVGGIPIPKRVYA